MKMEKREATSFETFVVIQGALTITILLQAQMWHGSGKEMVLVQATQMAQLLQQLV